MKNKEKYFNEMTDIIINGGMLALLEDDKIADCDAIMCYDCQFFKGKGKEGCSIQRKKWLEAEYCEFKKGELVEVSDDEKSWNLRFFNYMSNTHYYHCSRDKDGSDYGWNWKYCRKYGTLGGLI